MYLDKILFWEYAGILLRLLMVCVWGFGILYTLSKIRRYKYMLVGALGCFGMFLLSLADVYRLSLENFFFLWIHVEQLGLIRQHTTEIYNRLHLGYTWEALQALFHVSLLFGLAGQYLEKEEGIKEQEIEQGEAISPEAEEAPKQPKPAVAKSAGVAKSKSGRDFIPLDVEKKAQPQSQPQKKEPSKVESDVFFDDTLGISPPASPSRAKEQEKQGEDIQEFQAASTYTDINVSDVKASLRSAPALEEGPKIQYEYEPIEAKNIDHAQPPEEFTIRKEDEEELLVHPDGGAVQVPDIGEVVKGSPKDSFMIDAEQPDFKKSRTSISQANQPSSKKDAWMRQFEKQQDPNATEIGDSFQNKQPTELEDATDLLPKSRMSVEDTIPAEQMGEQPVFSHSPQQDPGIEDFTESPRHPFEEEPTFDLAAEPGSLIDPEDVPENVAAEKEEPDLTDFLEEEPTLDLPTKSSVQDEQSDSPFRDEEDMDFLKDLPHDEESQGEKPSYAEDKSFFSSEKEEGAENFVSDVGKRIGYDAPEELMAHLDLGKSVENPEEEPTADLHWDRSPQRGILPQIPEDFAEEKVEPSGETVVSSEQIDEKSPEDKDSWDDSSSPNERENVKFTDAVPTEKIQASAKEKKKKEKKEPEEKKRPVSLKGIRKSSILQKKEEEEGDEKGVFSLKENLKNSLASENIKKFDPKRFTPKPKSEED